MPSLKYRSARTKPLAPLGFGSHKLGGVRFCLCKRNAFREGMLALPYGSRILFQQPRMNCLCKGNTCGLTYQIAD